MKPTTFSLPLFIFVLFLLPAVLSGKEQKIKMNSVQELHLREIAAQGQVELDRAISQKEFLTCVPQESIPFPAVWPNEIKENAFSDEAMRDLMKCSVKKCAFNFLTPELELFEKLKTEEERQQAYIQFFKNRTAEKTGLDAGRTPYFIRSDSEAFEFCPSPELKSLLDDRPLKNSAFRLSSVRYNDRMRPTTRLLQSTSFPTKSGICYAEALLFSDHYDLDRLEIWKLEKNTLSVQVRHRIDLLNSWFRRLNKGALREELENVLHGQLQKAADCLQKEI